ncbi:hypothetical protein FQN50_006486 [Emmonsiellopsis sp. PD_5]|nr:hypothetical protein FQN50_006486 [Emmonsiellopsis sp. PD_5]
MPTSHAREQVKTLANAIDEITKKYILIAEGLQVDTNDVWLEATPDLTTLILSAIIYAFRLFTLFKVLEEESEDNVYQHILVDAAEYLHDGKGVYFSEVFSLHVKGKAIC